MADPLPEAVAPNIHTLMQRIQSWPKNRLPKLPIAEIANRALIVAREFAHDRPDLEAFYQPAVLRVEDAEALPAMVDALMVLDRRHAAADDGPEAPFERALVLRTQTVKHLRYAFEGDAEVEAVINEAAAMRGYRSLARSLGRLAGVCEARWPELRRSSRMTREDLDALNALAETLLHWDARPDAKREVADVRARAASMLFDHMSRVTRLARFALSDAPERRRAYPNLRVTAKPKPPPAPAPSNTDVEEAPAEQPSEG